MTEEEEGGEREIFGALTGQHTCRSGPRISARAHFHQSDGSDPQRNTTKEIKSTVWYPRYASPLAQL